MQRQLEVILGAILTVSRWLMVVLYVGLVGAIVVVGLEFFRELGAAFVGLGAASASTIVIVVLKLIDLVLIGHLAFILIISGLGVLRAAAVSKDQDIWSSLAEKTDLSAVKIRVIAAISAICSVDLLETFFDIHEYAKVDVLWKIATLLTFVVVGLLLVLMDRFARRVDG